jgi:hypothetical protein
MLGLQVVRVSIDDDSGRTKIKRLGRGERAILVNLAGPYAQRRYAPRSRWRGRSHTGFNSGADFDNVTDLIFDMHGKGKVAETYWRYVEAKAEALVVEHWKDIKSVAAALLRDGVMQGDIRVYFSAAPAAALSRRGNRPYAGADARDRRATRPQP